jgi:dihydroorotate dehydrogenase
MPIETNNWDVETYRNKLENCVFFLIYSPNTPGLRKLQGKKELEAVISKTIEARNQSLPDKKPILLKIAPDLNEQDKIDICDVILNNPKVRLFIFPQILFHKTNFV